VFPGSFDPVTRGHLDVIDRAAGLFERLVVAVVENPGKEPLFRPEERVALLRQELSGRPAIEVVSFRGLTVDLARSLGAGWIVRGLRSAEDAAAELPMALSNRHCGEAPIETVFVPAGAEVAFIASRLVREIAAAGGRLEPFVTPAVEAALRRKFAVKGAGTRPARGGGAGGAG
jgi:pantetheine-phosphate adenylyltransferase